MQVINSVRLRNFWADHELSETALRAWFQLTRSFDWVSPEAIAETFPGSRFHGDLVAFDVRGSTYFVIVSVDYARATYWVRDVQLHNVFRTDEWKSLAGREDAAGRTYAELIAEFPLRPITDDDALKQSITRVESLLTHAERSQDEQDYLDVLSLLIAEYEYQHISIPPVSSAEIVRALISEHKLSLAEIIPLLGNREKATALLQGVRPLDLRQGTRAARYFKLPLESFMDPDDLEIELPRPARRRR